MRESGLGENLEGAEVKGEGGGPLGEQPGRVPGPRLHVRFTVMSGKTAEASGSDA